MSDYDYHQDALRRAEERRRLNEWTQANRYALRAAEQDHQIGRLGLVIRVVLAVAIVATVSAILVPAFQPTYKPVYENGTHLLIGWCGGSVPPKDVLEDRGSDDEDRPDITWYPTCPKE